jgi:hypothetical protein
MISMAGAASSSLVYTAPNGSWREAEGTGDWKTTLAVD